MPDSATIVSRLLLIGDAGEPSVTGEPVVGVLADTAANLPGRTRIVFLGDNVYPDGLSPRSPDMRIPVLKLQSQIDAVPDGAEGIFVPGNHDWDSGGEFGLEAIQNQEAYLRQSETEVRMLPRAGCPGPMVDPRPGFELIALDTQWWLHPYERLEDECVNGPDTATVSAGIRGLMPGDATKRVVVAHHPIQTAGPHGGFFPWTEYVFPLTALDGRGLWQWFPLPLAGALALSPLSSAAGFGFGVFSAVVHPIVRWVGVTRQDLASTHYDRMVDQLNQAFSVNPPLVYAAGHDHGLQVFCGRPGEPIYQLVSGLGSSVKATPVGDTPLTLFAHSAPGFMMVDLLEDESVLLRVVELDPDGVVYWRWLAREAVPVECDPLLPVSAPGT